MKNKKAYESLAIVFVQMDEKSVLNASPVVGGDNDGSWLWGADEI